MWDGIEIELDLLYTSCSPDHDMNLSMKSPAIRRLFC
jgi:hypothetical protein